MILNFDLSLSSFRVKESPANLSVVLQEPDNCSPVRTMLGSFSQASGPDPHQVWQHLRGFLFVGNNVISWDVLAESHICLPQLKFSRLGSKLTPWRYASTWKVFIRLLFYMRFCLARQFDYELFYFVKDICTVHYSRVQERAQRVAPPTSHQNRPSRIEDVPFRSDWGIATVSWLHLFCS